MKPSPERAALVCWIGLAVLAAGCQTSEPPMVRRPSVRKDPCAERLHDLCGHLLLYYSTHGRLPPTLADLKPTGGLPLPPLVCPASEKPYVYDPTGLTIAHQPGRLVVYDPEPSHSGMRWGILVRKTTDGSSPTARVILVDEGEFTSAGGAGPGP